MLLDMRMMVILNAVSASSTVRKDFEKHWSNWKSEEESRPSGIRNPFYRLEYWEESCRIEETCFHSESSEWPPANVSIKNPRGDYIEKHERGLITTIRNDTDNTIDERMTTTRKQKWEGKQLYGRFKRLINNISHQKTWTWLRKGNL